MKEELFRINHGTLTYHNRMLIENINLRVFKSETHGIILDSTEVKNVLIKLLCGELKLSYGKVYIMENLIKDADINKKLRNHVALIDQTRHLIPTLTIYENIYFSQFHILYLNPKHYYKCARNLFEYFNIDIPLDKPVKDLTIYEGVVIELMTAYALERKLIVLSNITNILNSIEVASIFNLIDKLKKKGLSFLVINNIEDMKLRYTDRLTIIKGGNTIGIFDSKQINKDTLYRIFYYDQENTDIQHRYKYNNNSSNEIFSVHNLTDDILKNISFQVHKGEIVRILYTDETSVNRLISVLKGEHTSFVGNILLEGHNFKPMYGYMNYKNDIGFVEENSIERMLFKNLSAFDNLSYPLSNKVKWFWLKNRYKKSMEIQLQDILDPEKLKHTLSALSPDDQLKIVYCKWLLYNPKLLICVKPFSVADAQNQLTEKLITLLSERGIAILIITSSWPSFSSINGKILYLRNGVLENK